MLKIEVNGKELLVDKGYTIIQALDKNNVKIPRFCYHEKLSIAGNCRICLVEVLKVAKPIASCTLPIADNMQVFTNSILVRKARESVLELLLINHPLDCPICDQGGECDLQDQAYLFGNDKSRFYEIKRSVSDKIISPIIKTIMTRCIHCTRCVRFMTEVAGDSNLGVTGRGNTMEIGNYLNTSLNSELSGNIIDLCPVGALTSKSYSFVGRSWELKNYETIDIFDSLGSNIIIQTRGTQLLRVLPKINESLNDEWITDKVRFSLDGVNRQRLLEPYYQIRNNLLFSFLNIFLIEKLLFKKKIVSDWKFIYNIIKEQTYYFYSNKNKNIILGNQVNLELNNYLKILSYFLNFNNYIGTVQNKSNLIDLQQSYFLNINSLTELESLDVCLLIGINLRVEAPLLNIRLRKSYLKFNTLISSIGPTINPIYNLKKIGNSLKNLILLITGKNKFNFNYTQNMNVVFVFSNLLNIFNDFFNLFLQKRKIKSLNISSSIGCMNINELGSYTSSIANTSNLNYLISCDDISISHKNCFNIYQGSYDDKIAKFSDIVLASNNFFEESSTYINILGNSILNKNLIFLNYFVKSNLRVSYKIVEWLIDYLIPNKTFISNNNLINLNVKNYFSNIYFVSSFSNVIINNFINNFYKNNSISRSSLIMSKIVQFNNTSQINLNY